MVRPEITISRGQHGLITGATGSGKTLLASILLRPCQHVLILDIKCQFQPEREYSLVSSVEQLKRAREDWILFRPTPKTMHKEEYDRLFEWVYWRRNTRVYLDEAASIGESWASYPPYLKALYTQGRQLGIGVLASSQRPANIPGYMVSECQKLWKFFLLKRTDQKRMAEMMGEVVEEPYDYPESHSHASKHTFYYWDETMREQARQCILRLES